MVKYILLHLLVDYGDPPTYQVLVVIDQVYIPIDSTADVL